MQKEVFLDGRQMLLIKNFDRTNAQGQDILLKMSEGFLVTFPKPTAEIIPFIRLGSLKVSRQRRPK